MPNSIQALKGWCLFLTSCFDRAMGVGALITAPLCWYLFWEFKYVQISPPFNLWDTWFCSYFNTGGGGVKEISSLIKFHFMVRKTQEALKRSHHRTLTRHLGDTRPEWSASSVLKQPFDLLSLHFSTFRFLSQPAWNLPPGAKRSCLRFIHSVTYVVHSSLS